MNLRIACRYCIKRQQEEHFAALKEEERLYIASSSNTR
jgi:hypothetical protein